MGYIKQGFQLAIGMCLGKAVYDLINSTGGEQFNTWCLKNIGIPAILIIRLDLRLKKSEKTHSQNPIGFKVD